VDRSCAQSKFIQEAGAFNTPRHFKAWGHTGYRMLVFKLFKDLVKNKCDKGHTGLEYQVKLAEIVHFRTVEVQRVWWNRCFGTREWLQASGDKRSSDCKRIIRGIGFPQQGILFQKSLHRFAIFWIGFR
jgi:hypothetical protein